MIVDVPEEYTDSIEDTEEYLNTQVGIKDLIWIKDLLNEREWAKWHFASQDESELSSCPACGAEWRALDEEEKSMILTHTDTCGYVKWAQAVSVSYF